MPLLSEIVKRFPTNKDVHVSSRGRALWIVWQGELPPVVNQTLEEYGGIRVMAVTGQALWFFFSTDIFLALARLKVWSKYNPLSAFIEVLLATLELNVEHQMSLVLDPLLLTQEVEVPQELFIWIHPKAFDGFVRTPGLIFNKEATPEESMTPDEWELFDADSSLPYTSKQGWYAFLRPLGRPLDKGFLAGWDNMYVAVETVLQRLKLRYLVANNCFIISIDSLEDLRRYTYELLQLLEATKGLSNQYWPCLAVMVDKKQSAFNEDLLNKVNISWSDIMADTPYITYRNAFLLGDNFVFNDLSYSAAHASLDSWVILSLSELQLKKGQYVPVLIAEQLVRGEHESCFYCGARNHLPNKCPTRHAPYHKADLWRKLAYTEVAALNDAFRTIESVLLTRGLSGYDEFTSMDTQAGLLIQSLFEINLPAQVRIIEHMWAMQGRTFPKAMLITDDVCAMDVKEPIEFIRRGARDDSPAWSLLDRFLRAAPAEAISIEREIVTSLVRNPRDARLHSLSGFLALERGDLASAQNAWRNAERTSTTTILQSWHAYLQARLSEVQGLYTEAGERYAELSSLNAQWLDVGYRQLVCRVKMGFAEQIVTEIKEMVSKNPYIFNRFLIDPELERGSLCVLTSLYPLWFSAKESLEAGNANMHRVKAMLRDWFLDEDTKAMAFSDEIARLESISKIDSYAILLRILRSRPVLEKAIIAYIDAGVEVLKQNFKKFLAALEIIRDEASWFPFPALLVEFNRIFNSCADRLNWAFSTNFYEARAFKQAREYSTELVDLLKQLESRLMVLRVVRDGTLCFLLLWRTFLWLEIIGVSLCLTVVPALLIYGDVIGLGWVQDIIRSNHWELQRILLIIVTMLSLGIAVLRATLAFEKRRDRLLSDARTERKDAQRKRLDRLREQLRTQQPTRELKVAGGK